MRRLLKRFLLLCLLLCPIAVAALAWFALETQPLVGPYRPLNQSDIDRARRVIKANDPRRLPAGIERRVQIGERDLNLVANYLLQRFGGSLQAELHPGQVRLSGSIRIPELTLKPYLNIRLLVTGGGDEARVSALRIGQVPVPDPVSRLIIRALMAHLYQTEQGALTREIVRKIEFTAGRLALTIRWQPDLIERARNSLTSPGERDAIAAYYRKLVTLQAAGRLGRGSLSTTLQPLFQLALQRSRSGADPVAENRSLLLVLGVWATNRGMGRLLAAGHRWGRIRRFGLTLEGRIDLAQHFLVSAAIASGSDSILSDAVGLFKEVSDSRGGSGFSFADLTADRAGTRFGELATRTITSARRLQQRLAAGVRESEMFPRAGDLPENLSAAGFRRRYGEIGSPAYNEVAAEIERRIAVCPLYRELEQPES